MANTPTGSELDAMAELVKQMWERFIRPRVMDELMKHSLEGYKASVVSNNGDGTLTVVRPFDTQTMTLRCPPALANWAEAGDQVLVVSLGDASNSFILCKTDMEGFGSSSTGERIKNLDFSHLLSNYFTVKTEHDVLELYTVSRDEHGRIDQIEDSEGFETGVDWPEYEPLPARDVGYDNTDSGASSTNVQDALDELFEGGGGGGTAGTDYATPAQLADKAAKADLTNIQATGTTNTTGAAIPAGVYFYLNGVLHRAKTQIDVNATFTVNTNCEQVTVGGDLSIKTSALTNVATGTATNEVRYNALFVNVIFVSNGQTWLKPTSLGTLPGELWPSTEKKGVATTSSNQAVQINVSPSNGTINCQNDVAVTGRLSFNLFWLR